METQNILQMLGSWVGSGLIGAGVVYLINFRAKRRVEKAKASQEEAIADTKAAEATKSAVDVQVQQTKMRQDNVDWATELVKEFHQHKEETSQRLFDFQRVLVHIVGLWQNDNDKYCSKTGCMEREPELGSRKVVLPPWCVAIMDGSKYKKCKSNCEES